MRATLGPRERIRRKSDFAFIYRKGVRFRGTYFSLIYLPSLSGHSRLGVVAGRKVGGAVVRNRVKRWMRDAFRRNKTLLARPFDVVAVARTGIAALPRREFDGLFLAALSALKDRSASS
jgi:ribonuclease P protein component